MFLWLFSYFLFFYRKDLAISMRKAGAASTEPTCSRPLAMRSLILCSLVLITYHVAISGYRRTQSYRLGFVVSSNHVNASMYLDFRVFLIKKTTYQSLYVLLMESRQRR
jgi:hypothetical protein